MEKTPVGARMSYDLCLAIVGQWGSTGKSKNLIFKAHHFKSLKELMNQSHNLSFDAIILETIQINRNELETLVSGLKTPLFIKFDPKNEVDFKYKDVFYFKNEPDLERKIDHMRERLLTLRLENEIESLNKSLSTLSEFSEKVVHASKDLFITETRKFFETHFKMDKSHWLEVKESSTKLPPILQIRHQLENQKMDQSSLLADLDGCVMEIHNHKWFQIWNHSSGALFIFLWIDQGDGIKQCLILDKVKSLKVHEAQQNLSHLVLTLNRRWLLCLTVSQAQVQVYKDSLTDLYNQRFLNEVLLKKIEENKRYKTPFSVLFIDVDHFKRVNDSLGHLIGSGVLTRMGAVLQQQIRNSDYAFRYGGDEFILILSHTEGEDAFNVAERIRKTIENEKFVVNEIEVRVTVSIGLAFYPFHAKSAEEIIRIADEAMYYGKNKSRNVVYKAS